MALTEHTGEQEASISRATAIETLTTVAERRQVTVMFCDLEGSTALSARLDPEVLRKVLHDYQSVCAKVIRRYGGTISRFIGDGIMVLYGYPAAHEDDAERAVRSGLGIVESMAGLNAHLEKDWNISLNVRVGIHTGLVVAGDIDKEERLETMAIIGETPNIAARLEGLADPNTVVISPATYQLVHRVFDFRDQGIHSLKGISQGMKVYRVLGEHSVEEESRQAPHSWLTPLTGREQELAMLTGYLEKAREGNGQVILLTGDAGIGKSRLARALSEQLKGDSYTRLACFCSPYHQNSALYPVIDLLERQFELRREDGQQEKLSKLEASLAKHQLPLAETMPLLAHLFSITLDGRYPSPNLTPEGIRQRTLEILLRMLLETASRRTVLLLVEDLHWADPTTLDLLRLVIKQVPASSIMALLIARPGFLFPWETGSIVNRHTLTRLTSKEAADIVGRLTGGKGFPPEVLNQIIEKTDGVPLFVEELTKMILESELLQEREGHFELAGPLPSLAIPATLQDSLMARLDRMTTAKQVAQWGAVLGREFTYRMLREVSSLDEADLRQELERLEAAEILFQGGIPPDGSYIFKHSLIQEVAYRSLLRSTRQQLHERIALALEEKVPDIAEAQPELLARHFMEGGIPHQAVRYLHRAGVKAYGRSSTREAARFFEGAMEALETLPESRETLEQSIDIRFDLRNALNALGELPQVHERLREAEVIAERLTDQRRLGQISAYMCQHYWAVGEPGRAIESGDRAMAIAEEIGDFTLQVSACFYLGRAYHAMGDYPRAIDFLRTKVASPLDNEFIHERHHVAGYPSVLARIWLGWSLAELGKFAEGVTVSRDAIQIAETGGHPFSLAGAYFGAGLVHLRRGDLEEAVVELERAQKICSEFTIPVWLPYIETHLGFAYALTGRFPEATALLEGALEGSAAMRREADRPLHLAWLGETHLLAGNMPDAIASGERALQLSQRQKERGSHAWSLRLLGMVSSHQEPPDVDKAEAYYGEAFTLCERLGLQPLKAHCLLGLGTLHAHAGQAEPARVELSEALELYRGMGITHWSAQAEEALNWLREGR